MPEQEEKPEGFESEPDIEQHQRPGQPGTTDEEPEEPDNG